MATIEYPISLNAINTEVASVHTDEKERRLFEINNKKKTIEEESDYINKRNGIRRQLEVHNG